MSAFHQPQDGGSARLTSSSSASTNASVRPSHEVARHLSEKSQEAADGSASHEKDVEREAAPKDTSGDKSFEVKFDENDPLNPRMRYSPARKWIMVLVVSSTSLCVTCTSSLYTSTYQQIQPEFYTSQEIATLGLSLFVAGLGLGPMLLAPLSEVCEHPGHHLLCSSGSGPHCSVFLSTV